LLNYQRLFLGLQVLLKRAFLLVFIVLGTSPLAFIVAIAAMPRGLRHEHHGQHANTSAWINDRKFKTQEGDWANTGTRVPITSCVPGQRGVAEQPEGERQDLEISEIETSNPTPKSIAPDGPAKATHVDEFRGRKTQNPKHLGHKVGSAPVRP
jgi:hypothetical protein